MWQALGGYPIIQFKQRRDDMPVVNMSKREINSIIRKAETYGGIELGVVYNLRKTAFILVNDDTIVICGHEYVLDRKILENLLIQCNNFNSNFKLKHKCNKFVIFIDKT